MLVYKIVSSYVNPRSLYNKYIKVLLIILLNDSAELLVKKHCS